MSHTQWTMIRGTIGRFWCAVRHSRPSSPSGVRISTTCQFGHVIEFESEGPDEVEYPGESDDRCESDERADSEGRLVWSQSHRAEWSQNRRLDVPEAGSPEALAMIPMRAAAVHSPANSAATVASWEAIARDCSVDSTLSGWLHESWLAASRVVAGGTTGQNTDQIRSIPGPSSCGHPI